MRIALIEDDPPTRAQYRQWIASARPGLLIDEWDNRDEAQAAVLEHDYAAVVLDIELGRERNAGVAIINAINKVKRTPVLVVSAMPAALYRGVFKALDAWDYLQKTTFDEAEFVELFLDLLREASALRVREQSQLPAPVPPGSPGANEVAVDPLRQHGVIWKGARVNIPLTAQRILARLQAQRGEVVSYEDLYQVIKSGRNRDNVRKHVSTIREALRDIDPEFDAIENVPMRGFRWR